MKYWKKIIYLVLKQHQSENTQNFIKSLFGKAVVTTTAHAQKPATAAPAQAPKPQAQKPQAPAATSAPTKSVANPVSGAPAAQAASSASKRMCAKCLLRK